MLRQSGVEAVESRQDTEQSKVQKIWSGVFKVHNVDLGHLKRCTEVNTIVEESQSK